MQVFMQSEFQLGKEHLADTQSSVQGLSSLMNQHLTSLKPLQEMLERLDILYKKLISLDEEILKQEGSLNGMVEKYIWPHEIGIDRFHNKANIILSEIEH